MRPRSTQTKESRVHGPTLPISEEIHASKYRGTGESFREAMNRVASALGDGPEHFHEFRDILLDMRFMPAGRVQTAMGSLKSVTPYNCFVSGTIEDSFVEGHGSIMQRALEAAKTMRMGGGIGYDFSTLRPKGALIKKLQSRSSGPISFMDIFDAVCRCVASSGHRRGAQMGVMRVDHPDIEDFIHAKQNATRLTGFNVSIAITDEFMEAVQAGGSFDLRYGREVYKTVDAKALWEMIMRSTWDWAEPGVLFIDRINSQNNLYYCETIAATNPCGEQPLPPYGACLLGSFNLVKYVRTGRDADGADVRYIDLVQLRHDIPAVVRAMDNVVDRAVYPMYEQEKEAKSKRRMGLGVTGLANAIEACGYAYGTSEFCAMEGDVLAAIRDERCGRCSCTYFWLAPVKN
jgi:ribonucleoside-diphosphate reductase alpha chain